MPNGQGYCYCCDRNVINHKGFIKVVRILADSTPTFWENKAMQKEFNTIFITW